MTALVNKAGPVLSKVLGRREHQSLAEYTLGCSVQDAAMGKLVLNNFAAAVAMQPSLSGAQTYAMQVLRSALAVACDGALKGQRLVSAFARRIGMTPAVLNSAISAHDRVTAGEQPSFFTPRATHRTTSRDDWECAVDFLEFCSKPSTTSKEADRVYAHKQWDGYVEVNLEGMEES